MKKSMKRMSLCFTGAILFCLLMAGFVNYLSAQSGPLKGRLIKLDVSGPGSGDVKNMMENFLTEYDFILADDNQIPLLRMKASGRREGSRLNSTVTYLINKLELILPKVGLVYSSQPQPARDYGTEDAAKRSAIHLLKGYLKKDKTLIEKLEQLTTVNYYDLGLPGETAGRKFEMIERRLTELSIRVEKNGGVRKKLRDIETGMSLSNEKLASLALSIKEGKGRISEESVFQILNYQKQLLRAKKFLYLTSNACPRAVSKDYNAIGAIMIRVPTQGGQVLKSGSYSVYAENQCVVYERSEHHEGPRLFNTMDRLRSSSVGRYFKSPANYIDIKALAYHPGDHSVIVSKCGADAMMYANLRGMHPDKIFTEGRVVLIPE